MNKILVFDMDGTIADLYGVNDWLPKLRSENASPYMDAKPLYDMEVLNNILDILRYMGWQIVVTSWLAKNSTEEYKNAVRQAKIEWLNKHGFVYDHIHLVQYGTTKANCTRHMGGYQILIDDNPDILKGWTLGGTINASDNILAALIDLIVE